jgi:hypothetical protein
MTIYHIQRADNMAKQEPLIPTVIERRIALLAKEIIASVPPQLYDECVELLIETIATQADEIIKVPFSSLFRAEVREKINIKISHSRYSVGIQETV